MKKPGRSRKHSYIDQAAVIYERQRGFLPFYPGVPGADKRKTDPADFSFNQGPPLGMLPYLWRRFASLPDALRYYMRDDPGLPHGVIAANAMAELRTCYQILKVLNAEDDKYHDDLRAALEPLYGTNRGRTKEEEALFERLHARENDIRSRRDQNSDRASRIVRTLSRPVRANVTRSILDALGPFPFDYPSARAALEEWCTEALRDLRSERFTLDFSEDLRHNVGRGLRWTISPLIDAFENPRRFFSEVLPPLEPSDFDEERLRGTWHSLRRNDGGPIWPYTPLADALHRWGFGLLLNEKVRAVFEKASQEPTFSLVLAQAEGREAFRDLGRTPRTDLNLEVELRSYEAAGRGHRDEWMGSRAEQLGIAATTLRRYLAEARRLRKGGGK